VLKILWPGALPNDKFQIIFHPSLDKLLELTENGKYTSIPLEKRSQEFSAILSHLKIGEFWKRTKKHRLLESGQKLSFLLDSNNYKKINLLDVGASDGITTCDLVNYLSSKYGIKANTYLVDRYCYILRLKHNHIVEYSTTDGQPLMVKIGPFAVMLRQSVFFAQHLPILHNLLMLLIKRYLNLTNFRGKMRLTGTIPLVNPIVLSLDNTHILEKDIFEFDPALVNSMDVIRASNIITNKHLSDKIIKKALHIFHSYLRQGGFLLISRNLITSEFETGSIWRKSGQRFNHVTDLTRQSEILDLVNNFTSAS
jgi:hypothetical protein